MERRLNGISVILADDERRSAPRQPARPAPVREKLLFWLRRRTLCAAELAEKTGVDLEVVKVTLVGMRVDRQVHVVYRRVIEYELDGPGRRRHLVSYYRARV